VKWKKNYLEERYYGKNISEHMNKILGWNAFAYLSTKKASMTGVW
jgi:hypothetical protein